MHSASYIFKLILIVHLLLFTELVNSQGLSVNSNQNDKALISPDNGRFNHSLVYSIQSETKESEALNRYVQIRKEFTTTLSPESIKNPEWNASFKPFHLDSIDCSDCMYWGKITIRNDSKSRLTDWILYVGISSYVDAYIFNQNDSLVSHQKAGRLFPAYEKKLQNGNRLARIVLNFSENEQLTIYLKIRSISGYLPKLDFKLSRDDFNKTADYIHQTNLDGLFIGFLLSIIIFNLIFLFTTKDFTFFYQFLFVSGVLVFMIDIMDLNCDFPILRNYPKFIEPINFISVVILNISYIQFVNKFIQLEKVFPDWIYKIKGLILLNLLSGAFIVLYYFITFNERITDTAISIVSAIQYAFLLILLFQFVQIKDKKSYFILIATFLFIGGGIIVGIIVALGYGVPLNFSKFIVLGNVSFFFFGLAYRMKLLKEEEHEAIRLKENQELKNRLYANITHEFRTPLTVIQGMAQQIESSLKPSATSKVDQAIQLIKSNGNRLLKLVNTILDLAKLESGRMKLNLEHADIIGFLRYSVQLFESYADSKKIYLKFLTELDTLEMDFDKEKIQQIVSNLVANAIKFTPQAGRIYITLKKLDVNRIPMLQLEVKDTGEGIPQSELGNIFNRFFQVEGSTHKLQGSGLGLALVHELVELMEGQIHVESELGKGTTFRIVLPVKIKSASIQLSETYKDTSKLPEGKYEDSPSNLIDNSELKNGLNPKSFIEQERDSNELIESEKPLLLIVDDNKDIIYYLQTLLENQYTIETAFNGLDGISLAQEIIPDIIISDILMPDKNGYELCDILKNDERTSHVPIILLTAKADTASRISGIQKGADAYLTKPFDEMELNVQLENLLNIRRSLQEHYRISESKLDSNESSKPIEDAFLLKLNAIIQSNMEDEDFGILQMCRAMQMSRTQLHRKITALTGKSTSIYLRSLRLQKAKQLLKKPEMNISEVAFAVGFSDPNYFTRTFMEEFGVTPSAYKLR